jgi:hypothetical protein|tara:strand:+ start:364 stop:1248 length:885 start_codon:yes stop_codon:yes gene_type:complete
MANGINELSALSSLLQMREPKEEQPERIKYVGEDLLFAREGSPESRENYEPMMRARWRMMDNFLDWMRPGQPGYGLSFGGEERRHKYINAPGHYIHKSGRPLDFVLGQLGNIVTYDRNKAGDIEDMDAPGFEGPFPAERHREFGKEFAEEIDRIGSTKDKEWWDKRVKSYARSVIGPYKQISEKWNELIKIHGLDLYKATQGLPSYAGDRDYYTQYDRLERNEGIASRIMGSGTGAINVSDQQMKRIEDSLVEWFEDIRNRKMEGLPTDKYFREIRLRRRNGPAHGPPISREQR